MCTYDALAYIMFRKRFGSRKESCFACFRFGRWSFLEEMELIFSLRAAGYMWGKSHLNYRMKQMEKVRKDSETAAGCNGQSLLYDPF